MLRLHRFLVPLFPRTHALPERALGLHVQGAGQVVDDQQLGIADQHSGGAGSLDLAAGQLDAARSDDRAEPVFELGQITYAERYASGAAGSGRGADAVRRRLHARVRCGAGTNPASSPTFL